MQISYHSALTKIQKLQNLKIKKKKTFFFLVTAGTPGIAQNWLVWPVFFPVRNRGVIRIYLLTSSVYSGHTGQYGTELTPLQ